jgi:hypothetical protein
MSPVNETVTEFERNARAVLAESVSRLDARTRSRLNQARHAALAAASAPRARWWSRFTLMPAASAAAAAVLVAFVLWHRPPAGEPPLEGRNTPVEDIDLLADGEALDLIEGWDGPFYEWATAQTEAGGESNG